MLGGLPGGNRLFHSFKNTQIGKSSENKKSACHSHKENGKRRLVGSAFNFHTEGGGGMPAVPPAGRGGMAAATFGAAWRGGIILPEPRKCMPLNRACKPAYAWREDKDSATLRCPEG